MINAISAQQSVFQSKLQFPQFRKNNRNVSFTSVADSEETLNKIKEVGRVIACLVGIAFFLISAGELMGFSLDKNINTHKTIVNMVIGGFLAVVYCKPAINFFKNLWNKINISKV